MGMFMLSTSYNDTDSVVNEPSDDSQMFALIDAFQSIALSSSASASASAAACSSANYFIEEPDPEPEP